MGTRASDCLIVPLKRGKPQYPVEERMAAEERMPMRDTGGTQRPADVYTKLRHISAKAKQEPGTAFTSLAHLLNEKVLSDSFERLKKEASAGIDGVTWQEYAADKERLLSALLGRMKAGTYRAQPVRRVYIEKEGGARRPLGIPSLEDKIVQRGVVTVLEAIYEQDFYDCSYGFRPRRGAHDALDALARLMYSGEVNYVIDADIKGYFDNVVHTTLRTLLRRRIADPNILRLIGKWLKVGVLEDGQLLVSQTGTPQGAVISPLLANIYLHYALDEWWYREVCPRLRGRAHLIRYADDFLLTFAREDDAQRVMRVLPRRLARFGLELHADKTRLLPFGRYAQKLKLQGKLEGGRLPTFAFLGFTHLYARSRTGVLAYRVTTMAKRLRRGLSAVRQWCRAHRHEPLGQQWERLCQKVAGHYNYYGRSTNYRSLVRFYRAVRLIWYRWLKRRSQRRHLWWKQYWDLLKRFPLPTPRITRPVRVLHPR